MLSFSIGGGYSYGKDPGWLLPAYPFLKANATNLGKTHFDKQMKHHDSVNGLIKKI